MYNLPSNIFLISLGECIGTFILITIILIITSPKNTKPYGASGIALPIGLALIFSIYIFGDSTGGHFNPAVSITMYMKNPQAFSIAMLFIYIISQIIGGFIALKMSEINGFYSLFY